MSTASARSKRMQRHHKRAKPASLHLVSLMDIFTILVFFLLVNQTEVQSLDIPDTIKLPESMATERPSETVVVMVTPTEIFVQGSPVASTADVEAQDELIVAALRTALKQQTDRILRAQSAADIVDREITILGDKGVPYRVLKKVMATCTDADYGKLSLAVIQKDEALNMASAP